MIFSDFCIENIHLKHSVEFMCFGYSLMKTFDISNFCSENIDFQTHCQVQCTLNGYFLVKTCVF